MRLLFVFVLVLNFSNLLVAEDNKAKPKASSGQQFGKIGEIKNKTTLSGVIANFDQFKEKTVTFEATPKKVCKKKGCWMVLKEGEHEVRTLFKDYGFFVPADIVGKRVRVQGVMEQKKVSAATIRHFMKDEGKKLEEVKKVKTGQIKYQFTASGVEII